MSVIIFSLYYCMVGNLDPCTRLNLPIATESDCHRYRDFYYAIGYTSKIGNEIYYQCKPTKN